MRDMSGGTRETAYYAKSKTGAHAAITNKEHLSRVSELAAQFGAATGQSREAELAGLFHDFGKYSARFQRVLTGEEHGIDHAFAGAAALYSQQKTSGAYKPIIEAVQGHHDGLVSLAELSTALRRTLADAEADYCPSGKTPSLRGQAEFQAALSAFLNDFPAFRFAKLDERAVSQGEYVRDMLDTRMLFSCLVDADYSVSASDDEPDYLSDNSGAALDAGAALRRLEEHLAKIRCTSTSDSAINRLRDEVYRSCGQAAEEPIGLFTLTAPTGVGKTLAMMHFALRHCLKHGLRRIIVVLPFLTLAEQTQKEYEKLFEEILVDHSQRELPDSMRELAARWDAPVIITTSVRFFESLFSDKPTDCRKLHNIAGSVVLFDEAQSLPSNLAKPTAEAVQALCGKFRCSMVFSTATQPDFSGIPGTEWAPREILPQNARLFAALRRVNTEWRLGKNEERTRAQTLGQIAEEMASMNNVCCIVNLRRHARKLIRELTEQKETADGVYLISTDLCPAHRLKVIEEIKSRQKRGEECCVVATQCIEAGVDLDFDVMYRSLAPLEAIVQAAGRCNRNGNCPGGGKLIVFEPTEDGRLYPDDNYEQGAASVKNMWNANNDLDINDPEVIRAYYLRSFSRGSGNKKLRQALEIESYSEVAELYKLIDNCGVRLVVPWPGAPELFCEVEAAGRENAVTLQLLRKANPITITCFDREFVKKAASPLRRRKGRELVETGYYILNTGFESCYNERWGLNTDGNLNENYFA